MQFFTTVLLSSLFASCESRISSHDNRGAGFEADITNHVSRMLPPGDSEDLVLDEGDCLICDKQHKNNKGEKLQMRFTGNWGAASKYVLSDEDTTCAMIDGTSVVSTPDTDGAKYNIKVLGYGEFGNVQIGDVFQFIPGQSAWTYFEFETENGPAQCKLHTSCSVPLVAGDNHGPFQLLDSGLCEPEPEESGCVLCDRDNKDKPSSLTLQYFADGKTSRYQDASFASCGEGSYPSSANITVNDATYEVEDGTIFTVLLERSAITTFDINGEDCFIHTSCSVPIVLGDQIGPFFLVDDGQCDEPDECIICNTDGGKKNKPEALIFRYRSEGQNSEYQGDDSTCVEKTYPSSTNVTVNGETFELTEGSTFTVNGVDSNGAFTDFAFTDTSFDCEIHTSCSVPLVPGDVIGPFELLGSNDCEPVEPDSNCIEASVRVGEDGTVEIDVTFDYTTLSPDRSFVQNCDPRDTSGSCDPTTGITDFTPLASDWIGFYPCDSEIVGEKLPFSVEPTFWSYTCYDEICYDRRGATEFDPIPKGNMTFADSTLLPQLSQGIYSSIAEVVAGGGGCYVVLLNRYEGYSPPPYYNICKGNEIQL